MTRVMIAVMTEYNQHSVIAMPVMISHDLSRDPGHDLTVRLSHDYNRAGF